MVRQACCPTQSLLARPELHGGRPEDRRMHGNGTQRPFHDQENQPRGKRGAANTEPAAGSPRAVRARRQEQEQGYARQGPAPWAIARRCSFVERRNPGNMQMRYGHPRPRQDSWDETPVKRGLFPSVGSAIEPGGYASEFDSRYHATGGAPVPTPVRNHGNQRTMGVQANRDSIMRQTRENYSGSDDDVQADTILDHTRLVGRRPFQDVGNADRSAMRGKDDKTGQNILRELRYPSRDDLQMSAISRDLLATATATAFESPAKGRATLGLALRLAVKDEFAHLDCAWGITEGGTTTQDRVAFALKKIATKVEKAYMLKALAPSADQASHQVGSAPASSPEERCAQLEAEIAAADLRIARYKEALQRPTHVQDSDSHKVLADLSDRLSAIHCGPDGVTVPGMAEFEEKVDQCIQGMAVANACSRQLFQQVEEEHKSLQDRNREFCPQTGGSQESSAVPITDGGARNILRGIQ